MHARAGRQLIACHMQDAEWFENKRSKKSNGHPHANGITTAAAAQHNELDAEDEFEVTLLMMPTCALGMP